MISYEVRRGKAVITTLSDAAKALAFAEINAHFPGQLTVYAVERREWEVKEAPPEPIPISDQAFERAAIARRRAAS